MYSPVILFRTSDFDSQEEMKIASKYFKVYTNRTAIPQNSLVISRYSCLPYFGELEHDLEYSGSKMINSYGNFIYVSEFNYYEDVKDLTFQTWFNLSDIPENGPFVLKGRTNSRKKQWSTHMFARNKGEATKIYCDLCNDDLLSSQGIIIRQYENLETYQIGINGQPFTNEWRFFYYGSNLLCYHYYWGIADEEIVKNAKIDQEGLQFAQKCANIVGLKTNFFCLDIARRTDGVWRLVEVNDGGCAGIELENAEDLYKNLQKLL